MSSLHLLTKISSDRAIRVFRAAVAAALAACCLLYIVFSWHWPLIGDATLVHYLILLLSHGMAPYRQIVDAQMPGAYLLDWLVIHTCGGGALGLRLFDFTLLLLAGLAMLWIAWPRDRYAAFCAAALFALLHGRDGIPQTAQRDLIIAVFMLAAFAFAFQTIRRFQPAWMLLSGFCAGSASTIKPTILPLVLLLPLAAFVLRRSGRKGLPALLWGTVGFVLPLAAVFVFLQREQAIPAFIAALHGMWPYYARLDNRSFGYLLTHCVSPMMPFVALWLILLAIRKFSSRERVLSTDWERWALWLGLALGLISYFSQRKGFPYHRYPALVFLLLIMAMDFSAALRNRGLLRLCGVTGLAAWSLIVAPVSLYKISTYDWHHDQLFDSLQSDLDRLGGPALSGHVQCLDTYNGCINTLYRMHLVESTGFLVDLYFWAPVQTPVTERMRSRFWSAIQQNPPQVFIVMKQDFPSPIPSYGKLNRWPRFAEWLQTNYTLAADRTGTRWIHRDSRDYPPISYRIYVRKHEPPA